MTDHRPLVAIALIATVCLLPAVASAQGFHAVHSRDGVDVWAAGQNGELYRSVNAGQSWMSGTLGNKALRGVAAQGFTVVVVGDSGKIWRSGDSGGTWALTVVPGAPRLNAVEMPSALAVCVVGAGGTIHRSDDGGLTWGPQTSPTAADLHAVRFRDASTGWAVGAAGAIARTSDGGATWTPVAAPTTNDLLAVDALGATVWVAGRDGACLRSVSDGASWNHVDLKMDSRSDVLAAWIESATTVTLAGGGGFIRKTTDGGASWTFGRHGMMAQVSDLFFTSPTHGWAPNNRNRVVLRTTDGGATWTNPTGVTTGHGFQQRLTDSGAIGSTFSLSGFDNRTLYAALGSRVFISRNAGDSWTQIATIPSTSRTHAFAVSPTDSNLWIAAVDASSGADRIKRTTNAGASWTDELLADFTSYGVPFEVHPDDPDTVYFMPDDGRVYRSTDFGDTWSELSNPGFRSPCDIVVVPDSANVIIVGDGITGSGQGEVFRSIDGGVTFELRWPDGVTSGGSEVPMLATPRLANHITTATHWGSGGVHISNDYGKTWPRVATTSSAWGADWAKDDPNVGLYGVYSGGQGYITHDQGASYFNHSLSGSNYGAYILDRANILMLQSGGIWKLNPVYNLAPNNIQSATVTTPNGGESWTAGTVRTIAWSASNVPVVRIEYRTGPAEPWQLITTVEGYAGSAQWTVPATPGTMCKVRVSDAFDGNPVDESNGTFTILAPALAATPQPLDFGDVPVGDEGVLVLTLDNPGTAATEITDVTSDDGAFAPGRRSLTIPPAGSDTIHVHFGPAAAQAYAGTLSITSNVAGSPTTVPLSGNGTQSAMLSLTAPGGGESWQYAHVEDVTWQSLFVGDIAIEYEKGADPGNWITITPSIEASVGTYGWTIPNDPAANVRLRIRELAGSLEDTSPAFDIVVPGFSGGPSVTDFGYVTVASTVEDTLHLENPGTAPLAVTDVLVSHPEFWVGRTSLTLAIGAGDSLGIFYRPAGAGRDTATVTVVSDDPASPHVFTVYGEGTTLLAADDAAPGAFALAQNRPNPFGGETTIRYALPAASDVTLEVYDVTGHRVAVLVRGPQPAGWHAVRFGRGAPTADGGRIGALPSGVYFYRVRAGESFAATRKMMLLR